jgi:hypothetical protein
MSIYSLRLYNKNTDIYLVTDTLSYKTLVGKRSVIRNYVDKITTVEVPDGYNKVQTSRYLKTSLRSYVDGDYLFIDSDTLITSNLEDVDQWDCLIGATADKHVPISVHPSRKFIIHNSKIVGFKIVNDSFYWNSGVFFVKDADVVRNFYKRWNEVWRTNCIKGVNSDQASLAKVNEEFDYLISDIGGIWNCQLTDNGLRYFDDAKIIHYFASTAKNRVSSPYVYYQDNIYNEIKKTGDIPNYIKDIICNSKKEFSELCRIISKEDICYMDTALHHLFINYKFAYKLHLFSARICVRFLDFMKKHNLIH